MRQTLTVASAFLAGALAFTLQTFPATADDGGSTSTQTQTSVAEHAQEALREADDLTRARLPKGASPAEELAHGRSATMALRDLALAKSDLSGADRRTASRILARPSEPDDFFFELDPQTMVSDCSTSIRFCVHYETTGEHRATAEFAAKVAQTMDQAHARLVGQLNYRAPVSDLSTSGTPGNPDGKFDVFLGDLGAYGFYGYCAPEPMSGRAYCAVDNDFAEFPGAPLDSLRVTAAHEYFHAIQFAYDIFEDMWFMEGSAVWAEEQVYDSINDYRQYLRDSVITKPSIPVDQDSFTNLRVYSSMLFFTYLTETLGVDSMRQAWVAARGDRFSLQAVRKVVEARKDWARFMGGFGVWNTRPPGLGYSERTAMPAGRYAVTKVLGLNGPRSSGVITRRLDHLASAAIRLMPGSKSTRTQRVRLSINGPTLVRGAVATVQRRLTNGTTRYSTVRLNRLGDATTVFRFRRSEVRSIVVTLTNASTRMINCGDFSQMVVYSCGGQGAYKDLWTFRARVIR